MRQAYTVSELEFFRNATLEICSSLKIEKVLDSIVATLDDKIPVYGISLHQYLPDTNEFRVLAVATLKGNAELDLKFKMPPELKEFASWQAEENFKIVDNCNADPVSKRLVDALYPHFKKSDLSILALRLDLKDERRICDLCLFSESNHSYNLNHARLLRMLNEPFAIACANFLTYRDLRLNKERLDADNRYLRKETNHLSENKIIGTSTAIKKINDLTGYVAPMDTSVLLTGETGVGKEIVANTIQMNSKRKDGPFIKVNCGAIPDSLLDSELFGHEKGSFTGAILQRRGRFELADGGTIFLDEIGEMPPSAQVRLLRVLQDGLFERVGGSQSVNVDLRVIASTHRDIPELISQGKFRQDLYFRLNVFPIYIPSLRERRDDIPILVDYFIRKASERLKMDPPVVAPGVLKQLQDYDWPGNVRELENIVERSLILHNSGPLVIRLHDCNKYDQTLNYPDENAETRVSSLDDVVSEHIIKALRASKGKIQGAGGAAQILKVNPNTLRKRMQKLNIPYGRKIEKSYY